MHEASVIIEPFNWFWSSRRSKQWQTDETKIIICKIFKINFMGLIRGGRGRGWNFNFKWAGKFL